MSRVYRATHSNPAGPSPVEVVEDGQVVGLLAHHVRHSPDGFSWGYAGSGPSELARCLLIDALGDAGACPECQGLGAVRYEELRESATGYVALVSVPEEGGDQCGSCWGSGYGAAVERTYQRFKAAVVAQWPQDGGWQISQAEIVAWCEQHGDREGADHG